MDMAVPSMPIRLRPAQPSDIARIAEFDEFNGDRLREVEAGTCFVAVSAGKVIAFASYEPRGLLGQPLLTNLCVHDEFRRHDRRLLTSPAARLQEP